MTKDTTYYGQTKIAYQIKRSSRKTLGISITHTGEVLVSAPEHLALEKIRSVIVRKGRWIVDRLHATARMPVVEPERQGLSGECYYHLGSPYRLRVIKASDNHVEIKRDRIVLACKFPERQSLRLTLLKDWYFKEANEILAERFQIHKQVFNNPPLNMCVKKLPKSWSRYRPAVKQIVFNMELIVAPLDCIDYVVNNEITRALRTQDNNKHTPMLRFSKSSDTDKLRADLQNFANGLSSLFGR